MTRWLWHPLGSLLHRCGRVLLAFGIAVALLLSALALRLAHGPIEVPGLASRIAADASNSLAPWRVTVDGSAIAWAGRVDPLDRPLELALERVRVLDQDGVLRAELPRVNVSLVLASLFRGEIVPRAIAISSPTLSIRRDQTGALQLEPMDARPTVEPEPAAAPAPLGVPETAGPATAGSAPASPPAPGRAAPLPNLLSEALDMERLPVSLRQLQRVRLDHAGLEIEDESLRAHWGLGGLDLDLRRERDGSVSGRVAAGLRFRALRLPLTSEFRVHPGGSGRIALVLPGLQPTEIGRAWPQLASLRGLGLPVDARAALEWTKGSQPRLGFALAFGRGVVVPGLLADLPGASRADGTGPALAVPVESARAEGTVLFDAALQPQRIELEPASLRIGPFPGSQATAVTLSLRTALDSGLWTGSASASVDRLALADLSRLWPEGLGGNERAWILENLTAGELRRFSAALGFAFDPGTSSVSVNRLEGTGRGADVEVHWLRPIPPVTGLSGEVTLGLDEIRIDTQGGRSGEIAFRGGTIRIASLQKSPQRAQIAFDLASQAPALLGLLQHPRLKLFEKRPLEIAGATGSVVGKIEVSLPLLNDVRTEDIAFSGEGQIRDGRIPKVLVGQDLTQVQMGFSLDQNGIRVSGTGAVNGDPLRLEHVEEFRSGPASQVLVRETLTTRADATALVPFGIDLAPFVSGPIGIEAKVTRRRSGQAEVAVQADLRDARLGIADLEWEKRPGSPATASGTLRLDRDRPVSIEAARVDAGPDRARGRAVIGRQGGIELWDLAEIRLGETRAAGRIRPPATPADPLAFDMTGQVFDASPFLRPPDPNAPSGDEATRVKVDARFGRMITGPERSLGQVVLSLDQQGGRMRRLDASGRTGEAGTFHAKIEPAQGGRSLVIDSDDAGSLLASLGVVRSMTAGKLSVRGAWSDQKPGRPLEGRVEITAFRMRETPAVVRVLSGMSLLGLPDLARGPGLGFDRLTAPFSLTGEMLELREARAFSSSIGLTATGSIAIARYEADLTGTIVPAYAINSALGNIPILGRLFSPETGGGLFAATFSVKGPLGDPNVSVNPLSALTPGILRNIFGMASEGRAPELPPVNEGR